MVNRNLSSQCLLIKPMIRRLEDFFYKFRSLYIDAVFDEGKNLPDSLVRTLSTIDCIIRDFEW